MMKSGKKVWSHRRADLALFQSPPLSCLLCQWCHVAPADLGPVPRLPNSARTAPVSRVSPPPQNPHRPPQDPPYYASRLVCCLQSAVQARDHRMEPWITWKCWKSGRIAMDCFGGLWMRLDWTLTTCYCATDAGRPQDRRTRHP